MKIRAINSNEVEVWLYGYIGDDITASDFLKALREQEESGKTILIRINTRGGDMWEGIPMYNSLAESKSETIGIIDGLAASMGTIVMCGCKKLKIASNAKIMIHGPRGGDYATVEKLETVVQTMKDMRDDMAKVYAKRTGKTEKWVMDNWLSDGKDHWFTAEEALEANLVDEVIESRGKMAASTDLKMVAAFYDEQLSKNSNNQNKYTMNKKQIIAALNKTKLVTLHETDASDEAIDNAVSIVVAKLGDKENEITRLTSENDKLKLEAKEAKTESLKERATIMVESFVGSKITADVKEHYINLASASEDSFKATKEILTKQPAYQSPSAAIAATTQGFEGKSKSELVKIYDEMFKDGSLAELKAESEDQYNALYKAKYGKEPKSK